MQAELVYYGKFNDLFYLDSIPWDQFIYFHSWLRKTKKEEADAQQKAKKQQEQAMSAARSKGSSRRPR